MTVFKKNSRCLSLKKISFAICDSAGKFSNTCLREEENNQGTAANTAAASLLSSICNSTTSLRLLPLSFSLCLPKSVSINPNFATPLPQHSTAIENYAPFVLRSDFLFCFLFELRSTVPNAFRGLFRGQAFREILISHRNPSPPFRIVYHTVLTVVSIWSIGFLSVSLLAYNYISLCK